ncbi:MAG: LuxR family transcriptional regulator [Leeuwenhoekiella sp.]|uniref:Regulatory protein, luxR family n=3 Tax=Leeuwenhoekiella TaxID=283735 RepID=A0A1M5ZC84_9FLAO|nr:LuxR family transcriptional regulator [Leeuwenhoekiella sp.]MAW93884.1 LuxR family transcriptional regulator [Leeuwenhoekiella sp.]SHI21814.1 regulatory protein, luxR family [Leeuwenhoekiella palythoae]|tara:strand:+ start:3704 stop:4618 length:915 start_codon:yes stop_codon:yes gene_type:complete
MFGTSIHWTTFFYLLIDTFIVLLTLYFSRKKTRSSLRRFLYLGILFIAYNATGGFLPVENFPGPFILQYIITYGVAIALCVYIVYYLYKEYDIVVLKFNSSIRNLAILASVSFVVLFLIPYFLTESLKSARFLFTIPISIIAFIFLFIFYRRIANPSNPNTFIVRRNKLSMVSVASIALLPICTVIGDYQWITFTVMNLAFFAITAIEADRYLYFIENNNRMYEVFALKKKQRDESVERKIIYEDLTRREIEVALSILSNLSYKNIAKDLFIAESTVSKHASNIFKKTGVKNRREFLKRFRKKK